MSARILIEKLRTAAQRPVEQELRERLLLALGKPHKPLSAPLFKR